jgi:hypothetical protein
LEQLIAGFHLVPLLLQGMGPSQGALNFLLGSLSGHGPKREQGDVVLAHYEGSCHLL